MQLPKTNIKSYDELREAKAEEKKMAAMNKNFSHLVKCLSIITRSIKSEGNPYGHDNIDIDIQNEEKLLQT